MKFLVIMSDNRKLESNDNLADYNSIVAAINYEYCKKYNYDFKYFIPYLTGSTDPLNISLDPVTGKLRHCAWAKILSTIYEFNSGYDYIVYIDSDCIFKNFDISLETFIKDYLSYDLIFLNNKPYMHPECPCSGFYIVKVCNGSKKILEDWYCFNFAGRINVARFEQGAMFYMYKSLNIKVLDLWMLNEEPGQFLRHVCSKVACKRLKYFKEVLKMKSIDYKSNIDSINTVEYDTTSVALKYNLLKQR